MVSLNFVSTLLGAELTMPSGVWESVIGWIYSFVGDYGFTILILSVLLKLILLPIEFFQRKSTMKTAQAQARIAPQMQKIQEKYAGDKNMLNQKQMELFKKEHISPFGSCGIMLVYFILNIVLFFTLFNAMNNITNVSIKEQYSQLKTAYYSVEVVDENNITTLEKDARNQAVLECYKDIHMGWLWVENIWRPDTVASPIASFEEYQRVAKIEKDKVDEAKAEYNLIMNPLREKVRGNNGLYILIVLAAVCSFLTMFLGQLAQKKKQQKSEVDKGRILNAEGKTENADPNKSSNIMSKVMMFILPFIMVMITLNYSTAFAIYIVAISLVSVISTLIFNSILGKMDLNKPSKKVEEKQRVQNRPEYSRYTN